MRGHLASVSNAQSVNSSAVNRPPGRAWSLECVDGNDGGGCDQGWIGADVEADIEAGVEVGAAVGGMHPPGGGKRAAGGNTAWRDMGEEAAQMPVAHAHAHASPLSLQWASPLVRLAYPIPG